MAVTYHTFGGCFPQVNFGSGWLTLGTCADGGRIAEHVRHRDVRSDAGGPEVPVQKLFAGHTATVRFRLAAWDYAVLETCKQKSRANASAEGQGGQVGTFLQVAGHTFQLYLPTASDRPWRFPCVLLSGPQNVKEQTVETELDLVFEAWVPAAATATSTASTHLYHRTAP